MKTKLVTYWITTAALAFCIGTGGAAELAQVAGNIDGLVALGYPVYFIVLIGLWKVLGATAVLVPRFPRLKEWAYAGMFFNMTGAAVSTVVVTGSNEAWHSRRPAADGCPGCRFVGASTAQPRAGRTLSLADIFARLS